MIEYRLGSDWIYLCITHNRTHHFNTCGWTRHKHLSIWCVDRYCVTWVINRDFWGQINNLVVDLVIESFFMFGKRDSPLDQITGYYVFTRMPINILSVLKTRRELYSCYLWFHSHCIHVTEGYFSYDYFISFRKTLKERLQIPPRVQIGYQLHDDSMAKTGSVTRNKFSV